jgi:hypothetical protein
MKIILALVLLATASGCNSNKLRPECWKNKDDRPMNCDPSWCGAGGECPDEWAFQWIHGYDECLGAWTDDEVLHNDLLKGESSAVQHCYNWYLRAHQGITRDQVERYRLLNPQVRS